MRMTKEEKTLFDFIQPKDLVKILGNIFEVEEIGGTKAVLSYQNGTRLKDIISCVTEVYKINFKGDYHKVWEKENE